MSDAMNLMMGFIVFSSFAFLAMLCLALWVLAVVWLAGWVWICALALAGRFR